MFGVFYFLALAQFALADEPIVHVFSQCPPKNTEPPTLHLTADVPAFAIARCRNKDLPLNDLDEVNFSLLGSFDQVTSQPAVCQFFKKDGSNTYTVDVEVGWGEKLSHIVQQRKIHTFTCAYDAHGNAVSESETIGDWFLAPWEKQTLLGGNSTATFSLKVVDVLGSEIISDHISIGRKVRLYAEDTSGSITAFRALSCAAQNSVSRYYILRAGCGDGLVFQKNTGFETSGAVVLSPYFDAFKLAGGDDTVEFECRFTECSDPCNGNSCVVETSTRRRRSLKSLLGRPSIIAKSGKFKTR